MGGSSVLTKYEPVGSHGSFVYVGFCSKLGRPFDTKICKKCKKLFFACLDGEVESRLALSQKELLVVNILGRPSGVHAPWWPL